MPAPPDLLMNAAMIFGTVLGAGKIAMNGIGKSIIRIESKLDTIDAKVDDHGERIAVIESKEEVQI